MELAWHDWAGGIGVALIIIAYFLLQIGRLEARGIWYSVVNAVGAALILISLSQEFNLSAALIEGFWLVISLFGIGLYFRRRA